MAATVGVEIAGKRAEQRKSEGEARPTTSCKPAAPKLKRSVSWARRRASLIANRSTLGAQGVALVETLKVIGEKGSHHT